MKNKITAILLSLLVVTGCTTVRETAGQYERLPLKVTKTPEKVGKSCSTYSMFTDNDLSVETARRNGNITEIVSIERETTTGFFFYKACTIVRGN